MRFRSSRPQAEHSTLPDEAEEFAARVHSRLAEEAAKPLFVAVMGQTGVGKSSLINALFDTNLPTDPVRPCTMEPVEVTVTSTTAEHPLTFVDLPGVGESAAADPRYVEMYRRYVDTADVVIWALHADSRSLAGDVAWIRHVWAGDYTALEKITFVLTKADTIHADPWIVPVDDGPGGQVRVKPGPATAAILDQKCQHVKEVMTSLPGMTALDSPVACSSLLRHNPTAVMTAVVDHLDDLADPPPDAAPGHRSVGPEHRR